jgi:Domain of unknown function (DUF2431)
MDESLPVSSQDAAITSYLTLGDGDFTYSLDLAKYLYQRLNANEINSNSGGVRARLIATGIDTLAELQGKYKDTPFILDQMQQTQHPNLSVSIHHGINAIVDVSGENSGFGWIGNGADHVLFHHPHLGTEDAALHGQFLAHLFHSATRCWMKPDGGLFHLTLVRGQFERWRSEAASRRHGLVLLSTHRFAPPPVKNSSYHYRRHQTGRSFGSRRPSGESLTYTYGRVDFNGTYAITCLPWQEESIKQTLRNPETIKKDDSSELPFPCPFCDACFREERSRKCHIRDKHQSGQEHSEERGKKRRLDGILFECKQCQDKSGANRTFQSNEALQAHMLAKHTGLHNYIAPDWSFARKTSTTVNEKQQSYDPAISSTSEAANGGIHSEECRICGASTFGGTSKHLLSFVPTKTIAMFPCNYCGKPFREDRARLQHENNCVNKTST